MKRIVVCCDGTWNNEDSSANDTNVVRMSRAILPLDTRTTPPIHQVVYYHSGVGTGDAFDRLIGGGLGAGLSRNVQDCYRFIADNYVPDDEIILFGFSRGAYTARSIAGLIGWSGMLRKRDMDDFLSLWAGYKTKDQPGAEDARKRFPDRRAAVPISCVGVWDTVGALGIPGDPGTEFKKLYEFHDTKLGAHVRNAFHALALDERRKNFEPTIWQQSSEGAANKQVLRQVWFAGVHSNVGGGYDEHGLSDVALGWMAAQVAPLLGLDMEYLALRQDRRNEWALGMLYDSASGPIWSLLPHQVRKPFSTQPQSVTLESLHPSVLVRAAKGAQPKPSAYQLAVSAPDPAPELLELEKQLRWSKAVQSAASTASPPQEGFLARVLNGLTRL